MYLLFKKRSSWPICIIEANVSQSKEEKGAKSLLTFTYTEQTQGLQRHGSVTMKVCKVINYTSHNANYTVTKMMVNLDL